MKGNLVVLDVESYMKSVKENKYKLVHKGVDYTLCGKVLIDIAYYIYEGMFVAVFLPDKECDRGLDKLKKCLDTIGIEYYTTSNFPEGVTKHLNSWGDTYLNKIIKTDNRRIIHLVHDKLFLYGVSSVRGSVYTSATVRSQCVDGRILPPDTTVLGIALFGNYNYKLLPIDRTLDDIKLLFNYYTDNFENRHRRDTLFAYTKRIKEKIPSELTLMETLEERFRTILITKDRLEKDFSISKLDKDKIAIFADITQSLGLTDVNKNLLLRHGDNKFTDILKGFRRSDIFK